MGESATLAVQRAAADLRAGGATDVIDLGVGEPDLPTPKCVIDATIAALQAGFTKYTPAIGIPELREAIARRYRERHGGSWGMESVAVTVGAKQALYNVFMCLVEPSDEVIVPIPCWVSFPPQLRLAGAALVLVDCPAEGGFLPRAEAIEAAITPRTRAIVLNSPCNPTGAVIPRSGVQEIVELARERDLLVVWDETYENLTFEDDSPHVSAAAYHAELGDRLIVCNSFSKSYAMTGMRVGYLLAAPEIVGGVARLQGHMTSNPTSVAQRGALAALLEAEADVAAMRDEYARRRSWLIDELATVPGLELTPPRGTFYAFPRVNGLLERTGCADSVELAERLLREVHVAAVPGEAFEAPGFLRLSFAASQAHLEEAVARLRRFAGD